MFKNIIVASLLSVAFISCKSNKNDNKNNTPAKTQQKPTEPAKPTETTKPTETAKPTEAAVIKNESYEIALSNAKANVTVSSDNKEIIVKSNSGILKAFVVSSKKDLTNSNFDSTHKDYDKNLKLNDLGSKVSLSANDQYIYFIDHNNHIVPLTDGTTQFSEIKSFNRAKYDSKNDSIKELTNRINNVKNVSLTNNTDKAAAATKAKTEYDTAFDAHENEKSKEIIKKELNVLTAAFSATIESDAKEVENKLNVIKSNLASLKNLVSEYQKNKVLYETELQNSLKLEIDFLKVVNLDASVPANANDIKLAYSKFGNSNIGIAPSVDAKATEKTLADKKAALEKISAEYAASIIQLAALNKELNEANIELANLKISVNSEIDTKILEANKKLNELNAKILAEKNTIEKVKLEKQKNDLEKDITNLSTSKIS